LFDSKTLRKSCTIRYDASALGQAKSKNEDEHKHVLKLRMAFIDKEFLEEFEKENKASVRK